MIARLGLLVLLAFLLLVCWTLTNQSLLRYLLIGYIGGGAMITEASFFAGLLR